MLKAARAALHGDSVGPVISAEHYQWTDTAIIAKLRGDMHRLDWKSANTRRRADTAKQLRAFSHDVLKFDQLGECSVAASKLCGSVTVADLDVDEIEAILRIVDRKHLVTNLLVCHGQGRTG